MNKICKYIGLYSLIALGIISCGKTDEKKEIVKRDLGKYVYVDDNNTVHVNPHCYRLIRGKDDKGHDIYAKHPIDTLEFVITDKEYFRVCTRCVEDSIYERLVEISNRNQSNYNWEQTSKSDWESM